MKQRMNYSTTSITITIKIEKIKDLQSGCNLISYVEIIKRNNYVEKLIEKANLERQTCGE